MSSPSDVQMNNPMNMERQRKPRRKHKNSKLGCVQCKERKMKCDEGFPQCKNCRIRQVKIPCSYLSFTEEDKKQFLEEKKKQEESQNSPDSPQISSTSATDSPPVTRNNIAIKLVRHETPIVLKSQQQRFLCETETSSKMRLFYIRLVTSSFLTYDVAFTTHFSLVSYWLYIQLEKRVENLENYESNINSDDLNFLLDYTFRQKAITLKNLSNVVKNLIEAEQQKDYRKAFKYYSQLTIPTICLGALDLLNINSLKGYYIEGSLAVLKKLYTSTEDSSPIAAFVMESVGRTMSALFIPTYEFDVLYEISDVLKEFGSIVRKEDDEILSMHYKKLINYMDKIVSNSLVKHKRNDEFITSYPSDIIFELYNKFNLIIPSEVFTIPTMLNPIHKVFYSFYYMIGRALDNIFPESRYLTQHRFIGPTTVFPFDLKDMLGVKCNFSPDLIYFANYSLRVLVFFTRRSDFFNRFMVIMNPFPGKLPENRFLSRKTKKVKETQITSFKTNIIRPWNYPYLEKDPNTGVDTGSFPNNSTNGFDTPSSSHTSFSTNYGSLFPVDALTFDSANIHESLDGTIDLFDINTETGLLNCDYDPLVNDWRDDTLNTKSPIASIAKHLEDRNLLMKEFTKSE